MSTKLADLKDIPEGASLLVKTSDGTELVLFNIEGQIHALKNVCPHMGGPLNEGCLEGKTITCPWHGWQFDVTSGACENMPGEDADSIKITVRENAVYLLS